MAIPSRRLEAEGIRDAMLAVSGRLNLKTGGPGLIYFPTRRAQWISSDFKISR